MTVLSLDRVVSAAETFIGRYTVNYRYNAAGRYTDQSRPDYTQANPSYGNQIPPGPIFISAASGQYRLFTERGAGCGVWSGDSSRGTFLTTGGLSQSVTFTHTFGQIALYYWDWYAYDNDASVSTTIAVYQVTSDGAADGYEPDNTSGEAKAISNGETQNRSIHVAGNEDWARFTLTGASDVKLRTGARSGLAGGDTVIWLYGPNGSTTQVGYNDDANGTLWSELRAANLQPGTYFARIQEYGNNGTIGGYTLFLEVTTVPPPAGDSYEPDNTAPEAKSIATGQTQERSIHAVANEDWIRFSLSAANEVRLRTGPRSGLSGGDTVMWLYGPNSPTTQVAYNDDANGSLWSDIKANLGAGTYYVRIQEYGNNGTIAGYTLSLEAPAPPVLVGRFTVNYRYNAAGRYTDQSRPDYTQANPYQGNQIPPGPIFINATPGQYRLVTERGAGCGVWSGDSSRGTFLTTGGLTQSVAFNHAFGQIALYYWDWYTQDNDPTVETTIAVYRLPSAQ